MTLEIKLAADCFRGSDAVAAPEPLGFQYIDGIAAAAQEYRIAKSELLALRSTSPDDSEALQCALERFECARFSVKAAIRI